MSDVDDVHVFVGHGDALGIGRVIEFAVHGQTGLRRGGAYQVDDDAVAHQRSGTPVLTDVREQPVLDLVPLCALPRRTDVVGANPTPSLVTGSSASRAPVNYPFGDHLFVPNCSAIRGEPKSSRYPGASE